MTWIYDQRTGEFHHNNDFMGTGYSGIGPGLNNPQMQDIHDVGPIPKGTYTIEEAFTHPRLGRLAMPLTPDPSTHTFNRSGFYIHGDNGDGRKDSSHGCIILGPAIRQAISGSDDRRLLVI